MAIRIARLVGFLAILAMPAWAAPQTPFTPTPAPQPLQSIPFEGGVLTITESAEAEKTLAFDSVELSRNYDVSFDRIAEISGVQVALFWVGSGGNACGPSSVVVWKGDDGIESSEAGFEDACGSPPPAITADHIYYIPYLRPGSSDFVQSWAPSEGFRLAGEIYFVAQDGTTWADIDPAEVKHPYDLLANADVYALAESIAGDDLDHLSLGLSTAGGPQTTASGVLTLSGCVPHACGTEDAFMAVDTKAEKLYFAQQAPSDIKTWPELKGWPAEVRTAMEKTLKR